MSWLGTVANGLQGLASNPGVKAAGLVGNGLAKMGGEQGAYQPQGGQYQPQGQSGGLMSLINKFRANRNATNVGQNASPGAGIGAPQPGAQAGTLAGSMAPPRSSMPSY